MSKYKTFEGTLYNADYDVIKNFYWTDTCMTNAREFFISYSRRENLVGKWDIKRVIYRKSYRA